MRARAWRLTPEELTSLATVFATKYQPSWAIVSRPDSVRVAAYRHDCLVDLAATVDGRLFSPDVELRWRRDGLAVHVVAVTPSGDNRRGGNLDVVDDLPLPAGNLDVDDLELTPGPRRSYLLWGSPGADGWTEANLSRPLQYPWPAEPGKEVFLETETLDQDGTAALERFVDIGLEPRADGPTR